MPQKGRNKIVEDVVKEFQPIGKYRTRVIRNSRGDLAFDMREFVEPSQPGDFEGFTRRGIRIPLDNVEDLSKVLEEVQNASF